MVIGIGIDMVNIREIQSFLEDERLAASYRNHTFTPAEIAEGELRPDPAEYYAARFAAKEAVFKALAHDTARGEFDLRIVETLNHPDGCPYIHITEKLREIMREAGADRLHISITTEGEYAAAFVIAEAEEGAVSQADRG